MQPTSNANAAAGAVFVLGLESVFLSLTQFPSLPGFSAQVSPPHKTRLHRVCLPPSVKSLSASRFCPQVVLLYASTYVLVSLSIDRYHAIVHPMKFLQGGELPPQLTAVSQGLVLRGGRGCVQGYTLHNSSCPPPSLSSTSFNSGSDCPKQKKK